MRAGGYTSDPRTAKAGFTPGYDLVGAVEAIGESSTDDTISVGDTVVSLSVIGAHATHIVLPIGDLVKIEETDDLVKVAALPLNYMTAYGMLVRSAFPATSSTSSILIGSVAGGVGTAVAQVARMLFPQVKIFGTCSPDKFDFVRSLGVDPIDRHIDPPELPAVVRSLNAGEGVDIAYEATGSEANLRASLATTKDGVGRVIAIGFMGNIKSDGSGMDVQFDPVKFAKENKERVAWFSVTNSYWRAEKEVFKQDLRDVMVRAVREGRLEPFVGGVYRLEDKVVVDGMLASGKGVRGKLVYAVDEGMWEERGGEYRG
jgi:NADPH:quinone reductase